MNKQKNTQLLDKIKNGLIVSCQAEDHEPLGKPEILAAMAKSAVLGGAVGIRACYPKNIQFIINTVTVPVIGIVKKQYFDSQVFITPTIADALAVAETKPEIIALDATDRIRPNGESLSDIVTELRLKSSSLLMADIAVFDDAGKALDLGFDIIGTTLSGYTNVKKTVEPYEPDFELIEKLVKVYGSQIPIIAEGRIWTPEQARKALDLGVHAVVVGSAITRPTLITERFVKFIIKE